MQTLHVERLGKVLILTGGSLSCRADMDRALAGARFWRPRAVILEVTDDAGNVSRIWRAMREIDEAFSGVALALLCRNARALRRLRKTGLHAVAPLCATVEDALAVPAIRPWALWGTRILLLAAGKGTRAWPLTGLYPKPLLPLLGRPILHHLITHCASFGAEDIIINLACKGSQIEAAMGSGAELGVRIRYLHEGVMTPTGFRPEPSGSAQTLARVLRNDGHSDGPVIVMCADAPVDLDLAGMLWRHQTAGAEASVAVKTVPAEDTRRYGIFEADTTGRAHRFLEKPQQGETSSRLASTGIYIFSPSVRSAVRERQGADIGADLLPELVASGRIVRCHDPAFSWTDVGHFADYFRAELDAVSGALAGLSPAARPLRANILAEEGVTIDPAARIDGPAFLGEGAHIGPGVWLRGPVSIGAGCRIEGPSLIQNSVILPETRVTASAAVSGMVACGDWAVRPDFLPPRGATLPKLEGLDWVHRPASLQSAPESAAMSRVA